EKFWKFVVSSFVNGPPNICKIGTAFATISVAHVLVVSHEMLPALATIVACPIAIAVALPLLSMLAAAVVLCHCTVIGPLPGPSEDPVVLKSSNGGVLSDSFDASATFDMSAPPTA